jgi:Domain of unknown function (DUF4432)
MRTDVITLDTGELQVSVLPGKGCDIYVLRDLASGIDVLAKTRIGLSDLQAAAYAGNSAEAWLSHYLGGWQLILPNGGAAASVHGAEWGFHGEASQLRWTVDSASAGLLEASVRLLRAPLRVRRRLEVHGATLRIVDTVLNESSHDIDVMWGHHPAFGSPFLDESCIVSCGASVITADDEAPGTLLSAGSAHTWPTAVSAAGQELDLSMVPAARAGVAHLAYLSEFHAGFFAVTNPRLKLGVALRWPLTVFPCAWYWVEAGASAGFPWYGDHYTLAVEPATSWPARGMANLKDSGGDALTLAGSKEVQTEVEVTLFHDDRCVSAVGPGGAVSFVDSKRAAP